MAEFTCAECARLIFDASSDEPREPPLCAHCIALPGWHEDPKLRRLFGAALEEHRPQVRPVLFERLRFAFACLALLVAAVLPSDDAPE